MTKVNFQFIRLTQVIKLKVKLCVLPGGLPVVEKLMLTHIEKREDLKSGRWVSGLN